jgi:hypothetical protein
MNKMELKKLKFCVILYLGFSLNLLHAQEVLTASGGNASGIGGSASYSVGQIVYTTNSGTNGSVAQGVQQPFEISIVTGIEEANEIILTCTAYPNPVKDFLILKVEHFNQENLIYQLYDSDGKLLELRKVESNETSILMENFKPAIYLLKVIQNNKDIKSFKIIKK